MTENNSKKSQKAFTFTFVFVSYIKLSSEKEVPLNDLDTKKRPSSLALLFLQNHSFVVLNKRSCLTVLLVVVVIVVVSGVVLRVVVVIFVSAAIVVVFWVALGPGGSTQHFIDEDGHATSSRTS